jgi:hypothetical protein
MGMCEVKRFYNGIDKIITTTTINTVVLIMLQNNFNNDQKVTKINTFFSYGKVRHPWRGSIQNGQLLLCDSRTG